MLAAISLRVFGADFARLDPAERRDVVLHLLVEQRLLLIWDNFEAVHSMPDPAGATPPLDATECDELARFLGDRRRGLQRGNHHQPHRGGLAG